MKVALPDTLDRYFAAQNAHDADAMAACFAPDAGVRDEGRDYLGRDAILEWKRATIAKYGVTVEPREVAAKENSTTVIARVTGNFPGSPADLTYEFELSADGSIASLVIHG